MNLTTLRLEVRERVGELVADFFTDVEVDRAINEGLRRFHAEYRWPWMVTELDDALPTDESDLDLPQNITPNRVFNVSVNADSQLSPRLVERVPPDAGGRLRIAHWTHTGEPSWYYIISSVTDGDVTYVMRFVPTADVDYEVNYQYTRSPDDLSSGADNPDMPEDYHGAVAAWAAGQLFLKEMQISQKAQEQFGLYRAIVDQAKLDVGDNSTDEIVAWGREHPGERRIISQYDYIMSRIPPTLGS